MSRTILVTGASSGIGLAVARQMLDDGHQVIGLSRREAPIFQQANFLSLITDFSDLDALTSKLPIIKSQCAEINAVVFCAGYGQFGSLEEFSVAQIQAMISVNLTSQMLLTKTIIPILKTKDRGDLIYLGSEAALKGSRKGAVYCASKFAIRGFTQALREECARSKVRVTLINPGMVKTAFFDRLNFEPGDATGQAIEPEDIAHTVQFVLNSSTSIVFDEINLSPLNKVINFKK